MRHGLILIAFTGLLLLAFACRSSAQTTIESVRVGTHPGFTRLVFDSAGDEPIGLEQPSPEALEVIYEELEVKVGSGDLSKAARGAVKAVALPRKEPKNRIVVTFKRPGLQVKSFTLPGTSPDGNAYRLVVDLYPPGPPSRQTNQDASAQTGKSAAASQAAPPQGEATESKDAGPAAVEAAGTGGSDRTQGTVPAGDAAAGGVFARAEEAFQRWREKPVENQRAEEAIALYREFLDGFPEAPQAAAAHARLGLLYYGLEKLHAALPHLERALSSNSQVPEAARAWLALGNLQQASGNHVEAIQSYRNALKDSPESSIAAEAHYRLGTSLSIAGNHEEAVTVLQRSLEIDPTFHLEHPDIFRYLGESLFGVRDYAGSRDCLFRYLNLEPHIPDKDLVLARLAETYLHESQTDLAERLYAYIGTYFPHSEGEVIGKIRRAELLEKQGPEMQAEAYRTYQELSERSLSPPLNHFVQFKLAYSEWQNGDYDKSLQRIRNVMQGQENRASDDDFRALKEKVMLDRARAAFQSQDYAKVVQLYKEDPFVFDTQKSLEVVAMVAESYERLHYFPNALPLYETLLKNDPKDRWRMKTALCLLETGQVARAEQLLKQVNDPALTAEKAELLGRVAFSMRRYAEAMKHFDRQIEALGGDNAVPTATLIQYSRCLVEQGRHEAALPWIEKALQRLPRENAQDRLQVLLMAGRCYQKLGRYHEAIATYESLLPEVSSEDLRNQLVYELSNLYLQAGQPDKAEAKLSELLAASKEFWKLAAQQKMDYIRMRQGQTGLF